VHKHYKHLQVILGHQDMCMLATRMQLPISV